MSMALQQIAEGNDPQASGSFFLFKDFPQIKRNHSPPF